MDGYSQDSKLPASKLYFKIGVPTMNFPEGFNKIPCPVERTVILIGNKWSLLILRNLSLAEGPLRFSQILKSLRINSKTLSIKLSELVDYGIVEKKFFPEIPPRTEYTLTEKGRDLISVLHEMELWSKKWHNQYQSMDLHNLCNIR